MRICNKCLENHREFMGNTFLCPVIDVLNKIYRQLNANYAFFNVGNPVIYIDIHICNLETYILCMDIHICNLGTAILCMDIHVCNMESNIT